MKDLFQKRAQRLGSESSSLPPTHFTLMSILTGVVLSGFILSAIPETTNGALASNEARFMFSLSSTIYVVFYSFALDLNNPYKGIYQIRRSGPSTHIYQIKRLLMDIPSIKTYLTFGDDAKQKN